MYDVDIFLISMFRLNGVPHRKPTPGRRSTDSDGNDSNPMLFPSSLLVSHLLTLSSNQMFHALPAGLIPADLMSSTRTHHHDQ